MQETKLILDATLAAAVSAEISGPVAFAIGRVEALTLFASFVRAGGGTTAKAWIQTSLDGGVTYFDIANFAFATTTADRMYNLTAAAVTAIATPGDAALADNTVVNGFLGALFQVKLTTTGTYTGASTLKIWATPK